VRPSLLQIVARSLPAEELAGLRAQFHAIDADGEIQLAVVWWRDWRGCLRRRHTIGLLVSEKCGG
jgi:hypothetical protein